VLPGVSGVAQGFCSHGLLGCVGWGGCLFFENCTVDASILIRDICPSFFWVGSLVSCSDRLGALLVGVSGFVCSKFLRAHGGCLGIRSR
jgi:hypothetical protein